MEFDVQEILAKRKANIDKLNNYLDAGKTPDEKIVKKTLQNIRRAEGQLINAGFTDFDAINDDGTFTSYKSDIPQNAISTPTASSHDSNENEEETKTDLNNDDSINTSATEVDNTYTNESVDKSNDTLSQENNVNDKLSQELNINDDEISTEITEDYGSSNDKFDNSVNTHDTVVDNQANDLIDTLDTNDINTNDTFEVNNNASVDSNNDELDKKHTEESNSKKKLFKIKKNKTEKLGVSIKKSNINNITKLAKDSGRTPNNVVNFMLESIYDETSEGFNIEFAKKEEAKNTSYLIDERYSKAIEKISKRTNLSKSDIFNILLETALKDYI